MNETVIHFLNVTLDIGHSLSNYELFGEDSNLTTVWYNNNYPPFEMISLILSIETNSLELDKLRVNKNIKMIPIAVNSSCMHVFSTYYQDVMHYPGVFGLMTDNVFGREMKYDRYWAIDPHPSKLCLS